MGLVVVACEDLASRWLSSLGPILSEFVQGSSCRFGPDLNCHSARAWPSGLLRSSVFRGPGLRFHRGLVVLVRFGWSFFPGPLSLRILGLFGRFGCVRIFARLAPHVWSGFRQALPGVMVSLFLGRLGLLGLVSSFALRVCIS